MNNARSQDDERPTRAQPKTRVFLDPDGTGGDIIGVIVAAATGVEYGSQCEGLLNDGALWHRGVLSIGQPRMCADGNCS